MNSQSHPRLAAVLAAVNGAPVPERAAILERECAGDAALRREVERLLGRNDTSLRNGQRSSATGPSPVAPATLRVDAVGRLPPGGGEGPLVDAAYPPGTPIDEFTIVEPFGSGAFGVVYRARQSGPEERTVALKVLEGLPVSWRESRRFEEERRALARLDHPNVARIYFGGTTPRGHPYFAMEFIGEEGAGGKPAPRITEHANRRQLTIPQRIELFIDVCLAIEHAHQKGIVHRDLKPTNILVTRIDGRAIPKIIDFGIARLINDDDSPDPGRGRTLLTLRGELLGTPAYMSPEQVARAPADTRSDVYSLGVVLYELLCGVPPFPYDESSGPFDTHLRAIREDAPGRPSKAVVDVVGRQAPADARQRAKLLRGDLDAILLKVLEKDPGRRYQSAGALAEDLRRHLANQPIDARAPTVWYTLTRFTRRHRGLVTATTVVLLALLATTAWALTERREAQVHAGMANIRAAHSSLQFDDGDALHRYLDAVPEDQRRWEWGHLAARANRSLRRFDGHASQVAALAISPDGKTILGGCRDGKVMAWQGEAGVPRPIAEHIGRPGICDVWSVAWHPAGDRFATGSFDGSARLWSAGGSLIKEIRVPVAVPFETVYVVGFSPCGRWLAVGGGMPWSNRAFVALHDATTGACVWLDCSSHTGPVNDLTFSADRRWLASASDDMTVCLWDLERAVPAATLVMRAKEEVNAVAINPAGTLLAAGTTAREIELFELPSGRALRKLAGHTYPLASLAFSPDGSILASAAWDSTVRLWKMPDGSDHVVLRGHRGRVNRVVFTPDGRLFSASDDATVREWTASLEPEVPCLQVGSHDVLSLKYLADGTLAVASADGLRIWRPQTHRLEVLEKEPVMDLAVSPDGSTLAWVGAGRGSLRTWRPDAPVIDHPHPALARPLRMAAVPIDDRGVVVACEAGFMRLDFASREWTQLAPCPRTFGGAAVPEPIEFYDGWLRSDGHLSTVAWAAGTGVILENNGGSRRLAICASLTESASTAGGLLVAKDRQERSLFVYDARTGQQLRQLFGHREKVWAAAFSHDESRLASVGNDGMLRIWDWQGEQEVLALPHPAAAAAGARNSPRFRAVAWSLDDKTIATGSTNGIVNFWVGK